MRFGWKSYITTSQYKNKHAFSFYQKLAKFDLRIIRTCGAAGHGKGVNDTMSSFGANNILRHGIVTLDVLFSDSVNNVDYFAKNEPEFFYKNAPAYEVATKCFNDRKQDPLEINYCMKQHLMISEKRKKQYF